jgi:hypothetical protein
VLQAIVVLGVSMFATLLRLGDRGIDMRRTRILGGHGLWRCLTCHMAVHT